MDHCSSSISSSCNEVLENMDLLKEILLWVPAKQVLQCKCVCKKWLALISDPQFCHSHTLHHSCGPYPRVLLLKKDNKRTYSVVSVTNNSNDVEKKIQLDIPYTLPCFSDDDDVFVSHRIQEHSCNGLILRTVYPTRFRRLADFPEPDYQEESFIDICNPATNHYICLQYPRNEFHPPSSSAYLAFEPLRSPHFKVVLLTLGDRNDDNNNRRGYKIFLYSSETGSWSKVGDCYSEPPQIYVETGVYCNGAIHWFDPYFHDRLVYFDVNQVWFHEIPGPISVDWKEKRVKYFGESGGHLHLILGNYFHLYSDIWELKEDYSGWIVRYHLDLSFVDDCRAEANSWINITPYRLCVVRQENEDDSMLLFSRDEEIMAYNLKDHSTRVLYSVDVYSSFHLIPYFETLTCTGLGSQIIPLVKINHSANL